MEKDVIIRKKLKKSGKSHVFRFKDEEIELYDMKEDDIFDIDLKKVNKENN